MTAHAPTLRAHLARYHRPRGLRGLLLTLYRSAQWLLRSRKARLLGKENAP